MSDPTTIPSAAQRLIEAAQSLVLGLIEVDVAGSDAVVQAVQFKDLDALNAALDDISALDPTGSELARLAEIGAAVERLPEWGKVMRVGDAWVARIGDDSAYSAKNVAAAIAAALGGEQEPGT